MIRSRMVGRLLALVVGGFVLVGLSRIRPDANVLDILPSDLREVRALGLMLRHFGNPSELVIVIAAEDPDDAAAGAERLAMFLNSTKALNIRAYSAPPWHHHPQKLGQLAAFALINQPPANFSTLLERLTPSYAQSRMQESLQTLATSFLPEEITRAGYDPLGILDDLPVGLSPQAGSVEFISRDGRTRLVYVRPVDPTILRPNPKWTKEIMNALRTWHTTDPHGKDLRLSWTGEPAFVSEISTAMTRDMVLSSFASLAFASVIFLVAYGRIRPLRNILLYLGLSFVISLGLAGLVFPDMTVMSVGFAAIIAGLTVDYGFLIYQHWLHFRGATKELRRATSRTIWAAAGTSAIGFSSLNLSGIPGIAHLGTIVAVGVLTGAFLLTTFFPCDLAKTAHRRSHRNSRWKLPRFSEKHAGILRMFRLLAFGLLLGAASVLIFFGTPSFSTTTQALRPKTSVAYPTLDQLEGAFGNGGAGLLYLIITGRNPSEVATRAEMARNLLSTAQGHFSNLELPSALWPTPENYRPNLDLAASAWESLEALPSRLSDAGFSETGTFLTSEILREWKHWDRATGLVPDGEAWQWVARRTMSLGTGEAALCGTVQEVDPDTTDALVGALEGQGVFLTSWAKLGPALAVHARSQGAMAAILFLTLQTLCLYFAFRKVFDALLVLGTTALAMVLCLGVMRTFGIEWNFMNLCSTFLIISTGVDYSIHVLFSLREHQGNELLMLEHVGKPILLCMATTAFGFGSLAFAQTQGLANLGLICAIGVGSNFLMAVFILPTLWSLCQKISGNLISNPR